MQHGISISAIDFDNEPFTRSLTATLMSKVGTTFTPATLVMPGSSLISWSFLYNPGTEITITNLSGLSYTGVDTSPISSFGTIIAKFTAPTYNYLIENYTLYNLSINATFLSGTPLSSISFATYSIDYDSFPYVSLSAFLNYENTESDYYFFRLTSATPYSAIFSLSSTSFNLSSSFTKNFYKTYFTLNEQSTKYTTLSTFSFRRSTPCISSVNIVLSALSAIGSFSKWYSPHIFERSLSAKFVSSFITAPDFIAYPGEYFNTPSTRAAITPANLANSPGLGFIGEGHTEYIYLSTIPVAGPITKYAWKFGNFTDVYTGVVDSTDFTNFSSVVGISSTIGSYPRIPIQLQACNTTFPSGSPLFYRDDTTGEKTFYPYINSTVSPEGDELSTSKYFSSIVINPYPSVKYSFNSGISSTINLPVDISTSNFGYSIPVTYTASLSVKVSNGSDFTNNPTYYTLSSTVWSLNTSLWEAPTQISLPALNPAEYLYSLRLSGDGFIPSTVSYYNDTLVYLNATKFITCKINVPSYGGSSDWRSKTTNLNLSYKITSKAPSELKFYTPNKYVLTGVPVKFENISTRTNSLCSVTITFNDGTPTIVLSGAKVSNSFYTTFNSLGPKTIKATGIINYTPTPITLTLTDVVVVTPEYDSVYPDSYYSTSSPFSLPFSNKIQIAPNDWAVADVFNSCIEKFYKNLQYLESLGNPYNGTYSDYIGWLGPLITTTSTTLETVTSCPIHTWQDVNCNIPPYRNITWNNALSAGGYVGSFASCGTWKQQTCIGSRIAPNCLQKYCLLWQWYARKQDNSNIDITWKKTKSNQAYAKKWSYEPCELSPPTNCDEGHWNVNIPKLNRYYTPLSFCDLNRLYTSPFYQTQTLNSCNYCSVVSRNNIIYAAQKTQVKVLSSNYEATFYSFENLFDDVTAFSNIKNICIDSQNRIIVLDADLTQVGIYTITNNTWELFTSWGGVGSVNSKSRFLSPNDIHVDQLDNIWVTDIGLKAIKGFSNTGTWLITIKNDEFVTDVPISLCVDSQNNIHVLTSKQISVYTTQGTYLYSYDYKSYVSGTAVRINTSYNREIIYLCTNNQVIKFFRNGAFNGYIIKSKRCVNNITSVYQDEYRNLLITSNQNILKFSDLMKISPLKGKLPDYYWKLEDLYIHPEEYVQNWVYNKSLQRLWDCIEIFRSTVMFTNNQGICKQYKPPKYLKEDILVGQNEIVTSTVINRSLSYLWENFITLIDFFDSSCPTRTTT